MSSSPNPPIALPSVQQTTPTSNKGLFTWSQRVPHHVRSVQVQSGEGRLYREQHDDEGYLWMPGEIVSYVHRPMLASSFELGHTEVPRPG